MEKSTHLVQTTSNEPSEEVKVKKNRKQITTAKKHLADLEKFCKSSKMKSSMMLIMMIILIMMIMNTLVHLF